MELDYKKFRLYLKNKYNVTQAFIFIGWVNYNQDLYTSLQQAGFVLVFKPTLRYFKNGQVRVKADIDVELVLHAVALEYNNYDKAIIVSNDGDFACLAEYLEKNNKLLHILAPNKRYSLLLRPYAQYIGHIDQLRKSLEKK